MKAKKPTSRQKRRRDWLKASKQFVARYRISERDARMLAAIAIDWLRDQAPSRVNR